MSFIIFLATLAAAEAILRAADLRFLRESRYLLQPGGRGSGDFSVFRHDAELGWSPIPSIVSQHMGSHAISVAHNSLGLRDIEHDHEPKPTILFVGDSFVWGYDAEAEERFTERLREMMPGYRIVNAGVSAYGTDQELLWLKRLWNDVAPNVVVLMFCTDNDRKDNSSSARYDFHYKPYFVMTQTGLQLRGQPVPPSRHAYFADEGSIAHYSWLARVAISVYLQLRYGGVTVPDPTERLIDAMRDQVETGGAKFLVGLQRRERALERFLQSRKIEYAAFDGAEQYPLQGQHWTPRGHELVAERLLALFAQAGVWNPQSEIDGLAQPVSMERE